MKPARMAHRLRVLEAAAALSLVSVLLAVLPFRILARLAGRPEHGMNPPGPTPDAAAVAVGMSIAAAARRLPWHPMCLAQALAGSLMLRRRGLPATLCFGVARKDGKLQAHAWLICDGGTVCGGPAAAGLTAIASLHSERLP